MEAKGTPYSKLEHSSKLEGQCRVNLSTDKNDNSRPDADIRCRNHIKRRGLERLIQVVFAILISCLVALSLYLILVTGYQYQNQEINSADEAQFVVNNAAESNQTPNKYVYVNQGSDISPEFREVLIRLSRDRVKRDTDSNVCKENFEHCKTVIDSMVRIVSVVNNSMPHLQVLLKNLTTKANDANPTKSEFMELVECLQCKNNSIESNDKTNHQNVINDKRTIYSDHARIKNNVDIITNLLNDDGNNKNQDSISNSIESNENGVLNRKISVSESTRPVINDHSEESLIGTTQESLIRTSTSRMTIPKEPEVAATTTSAWNVQEGKMNRINDKELNRIIVDTLNKMEEVNATEIENGAMQRRMHPSNQGHGEASSLEREEFRRKPKGFLNAHERLIFNDQNQLNNNQETAPSQLPTAETMKTSQQVQLNPTMSWTPYQVCFYGPPPNNPIKPSGPDQASYPSSLPGSFPMTMPPQNPNIQNQMPNYVQVQAQYMQFPPVGPMQQFPENSGNFRGSNGQKNNPTGPGSDSNSAFSSYQSSGGVGPSGKSYYCTYIPAPTFQFPAVPGVAEYQRSSEGLRRRNNETEVDRTGRHFLFGKPYKTCSPNMIPCEDGRRCILRSQWCNGHVDCMDASDETQCSCRDRISPERICDGYFDCPHGEDELGCMGCPKTSFSCNDYNKQYISENCVPLSQRCDGIEQCFNGKDEMDCNLLTPANIEGSRAFTIGYTKGYLHRNYKGQWYPACSPIVSWAKAACVSEIGSNSDEIPEMKIHLISDKTYLGPYVSEIRGEVKLIPSCMNTAVHVQCPRFNCGTRVLSRQDPSQSLTSDEESQDSMTFREKMVFVNDSERQKKTNDKNDGKGDDFVGSQLRVVGGRASQPKAWPFLVAIYKNGQFHCGGVILNELWILTAAHCLEGYTNNYYEIQAGMLRRLSFSPMSQYKKARLAITHPRYSSKNMINDIGMIMLDDPLHFNRWVRPACLPEAEDSSTMSRSKPEAGSTCLAIGWGATSEHGPDPDNLREVEVPILQNCKYKLDQIQATVCAGYPEGGHDACQGDSGGPLMCRNSNSESQWYVGGIVSHGEGCARPDEPGAYTRVSYFVNWILETINADGTPLKRTPLKKCPGFSCEGGLGKCLPIESRCNRIVDCLYGEDELNCSGYWNSPQYRQWSDFDYPIEEVPIVENDIDNSTSWEEFRSNDKSHQSYRNSKDGNDKTVPSGDNNLGSTTTIPRSTSSNVEGLDVTVQSVTSGTKNGVTEVDDVPTTNDYDDIEGSTPRIGFTTEENPPVVFKCQKMLQSIPMIERCNRQVDCEDATDEMNCTCREYLLHFKPTAICDGFVDCKDKTDEEGCNICDEDQFFCRRSGICISMSKKCDTQFDCKYKEDELDCFALTDGNNVYLDAENRPFLSTNGILTRQIYGKWQTTCHRPRIASNQSTVMLIGQNMCEYFGFAGLHSSQSALVTNKELETVPWSKENDALNQEIPSTITIKNINNTCTGLYIRCKPAVASSVDKYIAVDPTNGNHVYLWPWLAAIFVEGEYRCSALLLNENWLLTASKCMEGIKLDENYTSAVLGYGPSFPIVDSPHQQISVINELQHIPDSSSVLLHMRYPVHPNRYVQPMFIEKQVYVASENDTCVAVGTDETFQMQSIFLKPVVKNCTDCLRCFVDESLPECPTNPKRDWSGTIFCYGKKSWYPAATFQNHTGPCSFRTPQALIGIDHVNPYLTGLMDTPRRPKLARCTGFRCTLGKCIAKDLLCDGVPDCTDKSDENTRFCPEYIKKCDEKAPNSTDNCACSRSQLRCNDGKCVHKSAFCDGVYDCVDGSDEPKNCTCSDYLKLTYPERICDGVRHCIDKTDESPGVCPCKDNSLKCRTLHGNDTCIPPDFICDGHDDCLDGEDEATCRMLLSLNNSKSGELIKRSYGVWHTACFNIPIADALDPAYICQSLGYTSGTINNNMTSNEVATIAKRDSFYLIRINSWSWMSLRDDKPLITLEKSNETCTRAFIDCV